MKGSALFRTTSIGITWFWLGVFAILPNIALFVVAFLDKGFGNFFIPEFTLQNFAELFSPTFVTVLWDTLRLSLLSTFFCLLAGYPFAYAVARASSKARPWLLLLVIIPFWTNSLIRTYALIFMIGAQGMVNKALIGLGIISTPIEIMYTDLAVFIGLTYTMLPFMILPLYATLEKLNPNLVDAAKDLGASSLRAFWHVTLPLSLPGIVAGCVLVFLPSLGCFYVPEVLGGATNMLLGTYIKNQFLISSNWPLGAAASSVMTILLVVLAILYRMTTLKTGQQMDEDIKEGAA